MKKLIGIFLIIILFAGIILLCKFTLDLRKQKDNIYEQITEIKTNIETNQNNENDYNQKKQQLETLKNEKKQIKEKYDEVNLWNQEIKSHLN